MLHPDIEFVKRLLIHRMRIEFPLLIHKMGILHLGEETNKKVRLKMSLLMFFKFRANNDGKRCTKSTMEKSEKKLKA